MTAMSRAVFAVLLSAAAANGPFDEMDGCSKALHDIAGTHHNDLELSAYCHATLPPAFCRDAITTLGSQPWSAEKVSSACAKWEGQWRAQAVAAPERQAGDWGALQSTIQECMKKKAEAGLCTDEKTGQPMSLDACIDHKQKMYPEKTKKIQDALNAFYSAAMGDATASAAKKFEQTPPISAGQNFGLVLPLGLMATVAGIGGLVAAKRLWKKSASFEPLPLVDNSQNE